MQSLRRSAARAFGSVAHGHGAHDIKNPTTDIVISLVLGECPLRTLAWQIELLPRSLVHLCSFPFLFRSQSCLCPTALFYFCVLLFECLCARLYALLIICALCLPFTSNTGHILSFLFAAHTPAGTGMAIAWNTLYAAPLKHKYAEASKGSGNINQTKH